MSYYRYILKYYSWILDLEISLNVVFFSTLLQIFHWGTPCTARHTGRSVPSGSAPGSPSSQLWLEQIRWEATKRRLYNLPQLALENILNNKILLNS